MDPELRRTLTTVLHAIERLLRLFRFERWLHIIAGSLTLVLLIYVVIRMLHTSEAINVTALSALFGASGLVTVSIARITYFFNRGFNLIEEVIRRLLNL